MVAVRGLWVSDVVQLARRLAMGCAAAGTATAQQVQTAAPAAPPAKHYVAALRMIVLSAFCGDAVDGDVVVIVVICKLRWLAVVTV